MGSGGCHMGIRMLGSGSIRSSIRCWVVVVVLMMMTVVVMRCRRNSIVWRIEWWWCGSGIRSSGCLYSR